MSDLNGGTQKRSGNDYSDEDNGLSKRLRGSIRDEPDVLEEFKKLVLKVPKVYGVQPKDTKPLYIVTRERDQVLKILNDEKVYCLNLFNRIKVMRDSFQLLIILNDPKFKANVEELLAGISCEFLDDNPHQSSTATLSFILVDFDLPSIDKKPGEKNSSSPYREIKLKLIAQNKGLMNESNFQILKVKTNQKPYVVVIQMANVISYKDVLEKKYLHLGTSVVQVIRYKNISFCNNCLQAGHVDTDCQSSYIACLKCGNTDHLFKTCTSKVSRCLSCIIRGSEDTKHMANALHCPFRLDLMDSMVSAEPVVTG